jgi:flagellar protein FliS
MARTIYDQYLEAEVLSADPVKLVRLLYRGAIDAVRAARQHLASRDIGKRSLEINRAWAILQELTCSLDYAQGGDLTVKLARLYAYMQARLIDANVKQAAAPLEEVESLLITLSEGWQAANPPAAQVEPHAYDEVQCEAMVLG